MNSDHRIVRYCCTHGKKWWKKNRIGKKWKATTIVFEIICILKSQNNDYTNIEITHLCTIY